MSRGTSVKATEIDHPDHAVTKFIKDDYCLVVDGLVYLDKVATYANGTTVLTIKRRTEEDD